MPVMRTHDFYSTTANAPMPPRIVAAPGSMAEVDAQRLALVQAGMTCQEIARGQGVTYQEVAVSVRRARAR